MTTSNLAYPVMVVGKKGDIDVCVDEDTLTTLNKTSLKAGSMIGSTIIDSTGIAARIEQAEFVAGKGSLWGWTMFLDRLIKVRYVLSEPFNVPAEDAKKMVLKYMKSHLNSVVDVQYWREEMHRVSETKTIRELIEVALPHYDIREFWKDFKKF